MKGKLRSESEWDVLVSEYLNSGESLSEFSRRWGFAASTLSKQVAKRRGGELAPTVSRSSFIEVSGSDGGFSVQSGSATITTPGGYRVEVCGDFNSQSLVRLFEVLKSC